MAKVIEEIKTCRTEIRNGDIVKWENMICIVNICNEMSVEDELQPIIVCDIVCLESGTLYDDVKQSEVQLYHGTIKLKNEE